MRNFQKFRFSSTGFRLAAIAGVAAMLGACAGTELEGARDLEPQGSEFNAQLYAGYISLSANEHGEYDFRDSDAFAMKAAAAAGGGDVMPTALEERVLPADKQEELSKARARLVAMLDGNGRDTTPEIAARAQLSFDCWMQEQEEGHQPDDIGSCRNAFYNLVIAAEVALRPAPPPEPEPAPEPVPAPEPSHVTYYIVFFDFDSSELSSSAQQTLDNAAATALEMRPYKVLIRGHTDRAGPEEYNLGLSEARGLSVASHLIDMGAGRFVIDVQGLGESEPIARTDDNVRHDRNRRAEVKLIQAE